MRRLRALVLTLALATTGCMIGPDFKPPAAPVADQWSNATTDAIDSTRQEYRDWWSALDDPVLTRLIEVAYQQNLTLQAAGIRVLQARAQLGVAIGEF